MAPLKGIPVTHGEGVDHGFGIFSHPATNRATAGLVPPTRATGGFRPHRGGRRPVDTGYGTGNPYAPPKGGAMGGAQAI